VSPRAARRRPGYGACTIVDQRVFETFTDPYFGHLFFAQITADCSN